MNIKYTVNLMILLFLLTISGANAQTIDELIQSVEAGSGDFHGFAFAVIKDGKIIHKSTGGYCKYGENTPITSKTLFPLASVSKSITALSVMKLVNEGHVNLDEEFAFAYLKKPLTIREILNQTTGYKFRGNKELESGVNRNQFLEEIKKQNIKCNGCYFYSNALFSLTDEILQQKKLSLSYAIKNFRESLGTNEIQLSPVDKKLPIASRHDLRHVYPNYGNYQLVAGAAAGVYASLDAMIEVLKVISGKRNDIISDSNLQQLFTQYSENDDIFKWGIHLPAKVISHYGLGFRIINNKNGEAFIFHGGKINGMFAFIGLIPRKNIGIVWMINGRKNKERNRNVLENLINFGLSA